MFTSDKLSKIKDSIQALNYANSNILLLHKVFENVLFNKHVYGCSKSRHSKSSIVFAVPLGESSPRLAQIEELLECIISYSDDHNEIVKERIYLTYVHWYIPHECRVWFGSPVEVWSDMYTSSLSYIPIQNISIQKSILEGT